MDGVRVLVDGLVGEADENRNGDGQQQDHDQSRAAHDGLVPLAGIAIRLMLVFLGFHRLTRAGLKTLAENDYVAIRIDAVNLENGLRNV